ncbi:MAG: phage antirepressor KilAC domain-containing protein [Fibrobacter sp.]|nr:phage antirepressor KilAC domain-containing protein [Fibrobacter sp.]
MNELFPVEEKTMTTSEVAKQLDTSNDVVLSNARKCLPEKQINNGKPTFWNLKEVTILVEFMKKNNNRTDSKTFGTVSKVTTKLTPALRIYNAMLEMQSAYEDELAIIKQRAELAEAKNERLMLSKNTFTATDIAKELGMTSAIALNKILCEKGIQYKARNSYVPTAKYSECGYYDIGDEEVNGILVHYSRFTQKGRDFILSILIQQKIA